MTKEYISRDEMIEQTKARIVLGAPRFNTGLEAAIEVATSISAADVVERPRWIPVTERLPEKRKWVLCRCEANIIEVLRWENDEWYHVPMHVYYPSFVTHWMPLPEPPKEEELCQ